MEASSAAATTVAAVAAGQHWDGPVMSIDAMVRTHGVPNALAFMLCGLLARRRRSSPAGTGAIRAPGAPTVTQEVGA
jgi:hypothetical protein